MSQKRQFSNIDVDNTSVTLDLIATTIWLTEFTFSTKLDMSNVCLHAFTLIYTSLNLRTYEKSCKKCVYEKESLLQTSKGLDFANITKVQENNK